MQETYTTGELIDNKITNQLHYIADNENGEYTWYGAYFIDYSSENEWNNENEESKWNFFKDKCSKKERTEKIKNSFLFQQQLYTELPVNSKEANFKLESFGADSWYTENNNYRFNGFYHLPICLVISDSIEQTGEVLYNGDYSYNLVKDQVFVNYLFKRNDSIIVFGFYFISEFNDDKVFVHRMNTYHINGTLIDQLLVDRNYFYLPLQLYFYSDFSMVKTLQ